MFTLYVDNKTIKTGMSLKKAFEWGHYFNKLGHTCDIVSELTGEVVLSIDSSVYVADALKYVP